MRPKAAGIKRKPLDGKAREYVEASIPGGNESMLSKTSPCNPLFLTFTIFFVMCRSARWWKENEKRKGAGQRDGAFRPWFHGGRCRCASRRLLGHRPLLFLIVAVSLHRYYLAARRGSAAHAHAHRLLSRPRQRISVHGAFELRRCVPVAPPSDALGVF